MKMFFAPFLLIFVVGCANLGVPIPNSDKQNLATAEIVFTALVEQADALAVSGDLSGGTLVTVQRVVAAGSAALDGAQVAIAQRNAADFDKWFAAVMAAVDELQRTIPAIAAAAPSN